MARKLYVNVFMTEIGPYGHVVSAKQYARLEGLMDHGMMIYREVEVRVTCGPEMSAAEVKACYRAVADVWIDGGKPNISQIRAAVKGLVRQKLMR